MKSEIDNETESDDPWTVGTLGTTIQSFHPMANPWVIIAIAGPIFFACWFMITGLVSLIIHRDHEAIVDIFMGLILTGTGLVALVVFLPSLTWHVHLCERGFYHDRLRTRRIFPWKLIREVREDIVHLYKTYADLKTGRELKTRVGFEVINLEGQSFTFGHNHEPWTESLERALRKAATGNGFFWKVREHHLVDD